MNFKNRFFVFSKRILSKKIYIAMLLLILTITAAYVLLPEKKQTSTIRVGIFCGYDTPYISDVFDALEDINSIYEFYQVENTNTLINDVKSGYAHCGFAIPDNFFEEYIKGNYKYKIVLYDSPSSTLSSAISETFFSCILKVCARDILLHTVNMPEYNTELTASLMDYMYSDSIFTIESLTNGIYNYKTETYKINIPIYEISLILILFSGLLGLLTFMTDKERNIYIALPGNVIEGIKFTNILTSLLPVYICCNISLLITGEAAMILTLFLYTIIVIAVSFVVDFIIRKSTLLLKVLPLIMLISIVCIFVKGLL